MDGESFLGFSSRRTHSGGVFFGFGNRDLAASRLAVLVPVPAGGHLDVLQKLGRTKR